MEPWETEMIDIKDPKADPNCKHCGGFGKVNIGNICTGFGGEIESIECSCIMYKAIGMDAETGEKINAS